MDMGALTDPWVTGPALRVQLKTTLRDVIVAPV